MILSFTCRNTQKLFEGERVIRRVNIELAAMRKLVMLNRAMEVFGKVVNAWCGEDF